MKFSKYFKDKIGIFCVYLSVMLVTLLLMKAFKSSVELIICVEVLFTLFYITDLLYDYLRKKKYYDNLINNINSLSQKYFVCETINEPSFYEGEIQYQILNEVNHSMIENVKKYRLGMENFKEYIEMWIHEIKLPVASATLILHNYREQEKAQNIFCDKMMHQISRVNNYIEQILYYVRSENAEKDYIIDECKLSKVIASAALKNKDDLLANNIDLSVENVAINVLTDAKWLEFMLNQIISNSIKYAKKTCGREIKLYACETEKSVILNIRDNGVGIPKSDLPRVFEKSFTGENGREYSKATGMGLYIVKKLCDKLGHKISIESAKGEYTLVKLEFFKNDFYKEAMG